MTLRDSDVAIDLSHLAGDSDRARLAYWLESTGVGAMSDLLQIVLSLVAMGLYVGMTCEKNNSVTLGFSGSPPTCPCRFGAEARLGVWTRNHADGDLCDGLPAALLFG